MNTSYILKGWDFFACSGTRVVASEPFFKNHPRLCSAIIPLMSRGQLLWGYWQSGPPKSVSFCPGQGHRMTWLSLCPFFLEILSRHQLPLFPRAESSESRPQQLCSVCWDGDPPVSFRKMRKAGGEECIWSPFLCCCCCLCRILLFRWPQGDITHPYWGYKFLFWFSVPFQHAALSFKFCHRS